jgi:hypothetical protein
MAISKSLGQLEQKNFAFRQAYSGVDAFFAGEQNATIDDFPNTVALADDFTEMIAGSDEMNEIPASVQDKVLLLVRTSFLLGLVVGDQGNDPQRT